jgi:putative heme-binding domain-containing protein
MARTYRNIVIFGLAVIIFFVYVCDALTRISGLGGAVGVVKGVNPEAGKSIFWGKGKCHTCHSIGSQGSAIRCPNLEGMVAIAGERVAERKSQGVAMASVTDYFVETIADPGAYVVEGYKNEMPLVYKPPIALKPDEIKAVITYLQSLGGEVDPSAIKLPPQIKEAKAEEVTAWEPYMKGDPEAGEYLFFDEEGNAACGKCHKIGDKGGEVGPELTSIAGTRTPQFIVKSIMEPSAEIASGFEPYLVATKDGRYISGVKKGEDETSITLGDQEGKLHPIPKSEIARMAQQKVSIMPGNLAEILTLEEFHHILAYLMTLEG